MIGGCRHHENKPSPRWQASYDLFTKNDADYRPLLAVDMRSCGWQQIETRRAPPSGVSDPQDIMTRGVMHPLGLSFKVYRVLGCEVKWLFWGFNTAEYVLLDN